ncbi:YSIRK-type signal peptide-containing protein [Streptococcus equi]|uniref:YSIRK-type signal peptide-containing protein n=1 Tax=Streptococcus equi TaxID=1336 RepID=UPI001D194752
MAKKEMKYYLRKSAFGLASVSAALLVGTTSVSARMLLRSDSAAAREKANKDLEALSVRYPGVDVESIKKQISDEIEPTKIAGLVTDAEMKAEAKAEAERQKEEERKHQEAWENAAKEELAKQNSQVVYMFGSKQGITLPQELLDVVGTPESKRSNSSTARL